MEKFSNIVHTHTFGCKVNGFDTSTMERLLEKKGLGQIDDSQTLIPDTVIVNTCTVTESADKQAKKLIRKIHRAYPETKIVVTGCYAQHKPQEIKSIPGVTHIVPIKEQFTLPQLLGWSEEVSDEFIPVRSKRVRANLKMQNGCNAYCSFCILPYIRGKSTSIPLENILEQAAYYEQQGHHELVLTGTHIGGYGRDLSPRMRFSDAIRSILNHAPNIKLRISSLEPTTLTPDVIRLVKENDRIRPHFHVPLQSGSDAVLKRMNRKYKAKHFQDRIESLRKTRDEMAIGTDVIVGFPGETEAEFQETVQLLEQSSITYLHVFPFSARPGTKANTAPDDVKPEIKKQRVKILREMSEKKRKEFLHKFISSQAKILVEKHRDENGWLCGVTPHYIPVHFEGSDRLKEMEVDVRMIRIQKNSQGDSYIQGEMI